MNQYLICRTGGAEVGTVFDAINAYANDDGTLQAIWLAGHDGSVQAVSIDDVGDGEWEVSSDAGAVEYLLVDETGAVETHTVHLAA